IEVGSGEVKPGIEPGPMWIQGQIGVELRERFIEKTNVKICTAQLEMGFRQIRIERQCATVILNDCLLGQAKGHAGDHSSRKIAVGEIRIERKARVGSRERLGCHFWIRVLKIAVCIGAGEVSMRRRKFVVQSDRPLKLADGRLVVLYCKSLLE